MKKEMTPLEKHIEHIGCEVCDKKTIITKKSLTKIFKDLFKDDKTPVTPEFVDGYGIIYNSLEALEELKKVLKIDITINNKGEHFLFIDDIAVTDVIPISENTANILKEILL